MQRITVIPPTPSGFRSRQNKTFYFIGTSIFELKPTSFTDGGVRTYADSKGYRSTAQVLIDLYAHAVVMYFMIGRRLATYLGDNSASSIKSVVVGNEGC